MLWVHSLRSSDFFNKVAFLINTIFPLLREKLYSVRVKLFVETSEGLTHAVFLTRRRPQNGVLGVNPSGDQKDKSFGGAKSGTYNEVLIHLPVWSKSTNLFF
jgi:hypothetical protein